MYFIYLFILSDIFEENYIDSSIERRSIVIVKVFENIASELVNNNTLYHCSLLN